MELNVNIAYLHTSLLSHIIAHIHTSLLSHIIAHLHTSLLSHIIAHFHNICKFLTCSSVILHYVSPFVLVLELDNKCSVLLSYF